MTTDSTNSGAWRNIAIAFALAFACAAGLSWAQSTKASKLQEDLAAATAHIQELSSRIQDLSKRDLPVSLSFRSALLGSGLVAMIRNNSAHDLEVAALLNSPATGVTKQANLLIPAGGVKEIGHAEGWPFAPGQRITLSNGSFRTADYAVPGA